MEIVICPRLFSTVEPPKHNPVLNTGALHAVFVMKGAVSSKLGFNMNRRLSGFVAVFFIFSCCAWAEETPTLGQLNEQEEHQKVFDLLDQTEVLLKRMDREFRMDCAKAVGYEPFCNCIASETPSAWGFSDYIAITTRTKEENGYEKLTPEYKAAYDKVSSVRDKCVALIKNKP